MFRPTGSSWTYQNINGKNHFGSRYSYDANGNILSLSRNALNGGTVQTMDSLTYFYTPNTNRLTHLTDATTSSPFTEDLESQSANNYSYDASGNLTRDNAEQLEIDWNIKGKVTKVTDNSTTPPKIISFDYDANGNRVKKKVSIANGPCNNNVTTYYVYADKGTLLATYSRQECVPNTVYLDEHTLYGSKRLGVRNYPGVGQSNRVSLDNVEVPNNQILYKREIFAKHYEVSDHLGNVRAVIGDTKWDAGGGIFRPNVITYSNYYPFGMAQPGRNLNSADYKFGYNGKEKDDEIKGSGNSYDYGFRMYDPRVAKFLSIDPLAAEYPWYTPFQFAGNTPIQAIDLDGLEPLYVSHFEAGKCGLPDIQKQSQWLVIGGYIEWYSYGKAALFNSKNNSSYYYKNISDKYDYYNWSSGFAKSKKIDTKWFAASANIVSRFQVGLIDYAGLGTPFEDISGINELTISEDTQNFLFTIAHRVQEFNMQIITEINSQGTMFGSSTGGYNNDIKVLASEQLVVQKVIDNLGDNKNKILKDYNSAFSAVQKTAAKIKGLADYLNIARDAVGPLDFGNYRHRLAIGVAGLRLQNGLGVSPAEILKDVENLMKEKNSQQQ